MSGILIKAMLESEVRGETREKLAQRLGVGIEVLTGLVDSFESAAGKGAWLSVVAERRVQNDVTAANWDELESITMAKLIKHIKDGRGTLNDLVMIAKIANSATRRTGINAGQSNAASGRIGITLPAGDMGIIELRLTPHLAQAAQQQDREPIEVAYERVDDPVILRKIADGTDDVGNDGN